MSPRCPGRAARWPPRWPRSRSTRTGSAPAGRSRDGSGPRSIRRRSRSPPRAARSAPARADRAPHSRACSRAASPCSSPDGIVVMWWSPARGACAGSPPRPARTRSSARNRRAAPGSPRPGRNTRPARAPAPRCSVRSAGRRSAGRSPRSRWRPSSPAGGALRPERRPRRPPGRRPPRWGTPSLARHLRFDLLDRLQMALEGGQGLGGPRLDVRVLRLLARALERGHVLLVVLHHHLHVLAVERGAARLRETVLLHLALARRLLRHLDALAGGQLRQLLVRLPVVGDHPLAELLHRVVAR